MPVYHSNHSYLFTKAVERHPDLTKDELEKEFKANVEGAYVTELLDKYGAFYQISRDQVAAFKEFVADEMIWRRYVCDKLEEKAEAKPEVVLTPEQTRDIIAKFKGEIAKKNEELAAEEQKVEDADCFGKFTQQYVSQPMQEAIELRAEKKRLEEEHAAEKKQLENEHKAKCQDYSTQIEKLRAENKRITAENGKVKRFNKDLEEKGAVQVRKFKVLLAEKTDLEKEVKSKDEEIEDLEDEVAELQQDNAELKEALAAHKDRISTLEEGISLYAQVLRDRARLEQYGNQDGSDL